MKVTPFLLFDGDCAEAMRFYQTCLGGQLTMIEVAQTRMKDWLPIELHDRIAHAQLISSAIELVATDWLHPTRKRVQGNSVAVYLESDTFAELHAAFEPLSHRSDAELLDELHDLPFGTYGHLADRYGVHWFFRGKSSGVAL